MIIRKFATILRGDATPFQLIAACLLASGLGFAPGFIQAPGLILTFAALLILLNANLALAGLVGLAAKLLSLALAPVSFSIGRFFLDGPTEGLFRSIINAPVLAWFGFDYYTTSGGLFLGLLFGALCGFTVAWAITAFRKTMKRLGDNSEAFNRFASKGWVKFLSVLLAGGASKRSFDELLSRRIGNPIRTLGLVFVALSTLLAIIFQQFASGPILRVAMISGLERANGATVDIESTELNLKENRLTVQGLAVADPNSLETDLFRAGVIQADLSGTSLLRRRAQIDRLVLQGAKHGEKRSEAGHLIVREIPPPKPKPTTDPSTKSIDDYIKDAKLWKERLAQLEEWLEKLSGPEEVPTDKDEDLEERLRRQVTQLGYHRVRATHLIEGSPTLSILDLTIDEITSTALVGETLSLHGTNLSTHPRLLGKPAGIRIESSKGSILFDTLLGASSGPENPNRIEFAYRNMDTDQLAGNLKVAGTAPVQGGTADLQVKGSWVASNGIQVDLVTQLTLNNSTLQLPNVGAAAVKELTIPIQVTGPLKNPDIRVDGKQLQEALTRAGVSQVKDKLVEKAQEELTKKLGGSLSEKAGGSIGGQGKKLLNNILGGGKETKP
jgi:uncharacterized protein (TIGR03546 family)